MSLLIPDARRSLLGGLIDDGALLRPAPPTVESAVDSYLRLRTTEHGWMVGRLVVPASQLDELAATLVSVLKPGDASVPIVTAFGSDAVSDASMAAAVHTLLDPAARIEGVLLPRHSSEPAEGVAGAIATGNGIQPGVLSMAGLPLHVPPDEVLQALAAASAVELRTSGLWLDLRSESVEPGALATVICQSSKLAVPFTVLCSELPAITQAHQHSHRPRYGALNLLAATLSADSARPEVAAILTDDNPQTYNIEFGGLTRNGESIRLSGSVGANRSPLVSLTTLEAAETLAALGSFDGTS